LQCFSSESQKKDELTSLRVFVQQIRFFFFIILFTIICVISFLALFFKSTFLHFLKIKGMALLKKTVKIGWKEGFFISVTIRL